MSESGKHLGRATIEVPVDMWEEWEAIFCTGARGVHLLFSNDMIRRAFRRDEAGVSLDDQALVDRLQPALSQLTAAESIFERQQLIADFDEELQAALVHLYFGLLERFVNGPHNEPEVLH